MILRASVPAKINLWLEVVGKRPDGYHDISSLMLPISVFDRLSIEIRPGGSGVSIVCDAPEIPSDDRNLAWRAADLYLKRNSIRAEVRMQLEKRIPWGAGLGGGSSDAAGVLVALNSFFKNASPCDELAGLALSLGADVPFFLHSLPALATGVGEKLQFADRAPDYPLVLIKPPVIAPTGSIYQSLELTKKSAQIRLENLSYNPWQFRDLIVNDLEPVSVRRFPVIALLKQWLIRQGALAASMSGSGPTVFGIFGSAQAAKDAAVIAGRDWPDCWVRAAEAMGRQNR